MRATPPSRRMSAGTRSRAITATAPASSAIFAWSAVTTSMITPPLSICARPRLAVQVPVSGEWPLLVGVLGAIGSTVMAGAPRVYGLDPRTFQGECTGVRVSLAGCGLLAQLGFGVSVACFRGASGGRLV